MEAFITISLVCLLFYALSGKKKEKAGSPGKKTPNMRGSSKPPFSTPKEVNTPPKKRIQVQITTTGSSQATTDTSIIDVSGNGYKIPNPGTDTVPEAAKPVAPYWSHFYVYSYDDIHRATPEQKAFYQQYKNYFLKGEYLDLQGNSNYAFILLFDLLNEGERHRDADLLETQLKTLAEHYPKTNSYCKNFLVQKLHKWGQSEAALRVSRESWYWYQSNPSPYDFTYYRLGGKYKSKLSLSDEEEKLVNKLYDPGNNFSSIEFCLLETIKLYLAAIKALDQVYLTEGATLEKEWQSIAGVVATKQFRYKEGSYNYKYQIESTANELYSLLFKHAENALREHYGHKRKINTDVTYRTEVKEMLQGRVFSKLEALFPTLLQYVKLPDEATEIALNAQNTTRWKGAFEKLTADFSVDKAPKFVENIMQLATLNKRNPSIENIFFEASKFLAKWDRVASLQLYVHYIYHDLKSASFDNKQLTKTIQKSVFKTTEQLQDFEQVINTLIKDKDVEKALQAIPQLFATKRKKIQLDTSAIKEVRAKHAGTVDLLDDILSDEAEETKTSFDPAPENSGEIKLTLNKEEHFISTPVLTNTLGLSPHQTDLLELFSKSNFSIAQNDVEAFARERGLFKNQLIENINEICYEALDDVLIEEDDDYFVIHENYYQQIFSK